jgi:hypothetical protein
MMCDKMETKTTGEKVKVKLRSGEVSPIGKALEDVRGTYIKNRWKSFSYGPIINRDREKPKAVLYFSAPINEQHLMVIRKSFEIIGINYDFTRGIELTVELLKP